MTPRTITTDAQARREAIPNLATVEARAVGDGDNASAARALAQDRADTIRDAVTVVSAEQISTTNIQVEHTSDVFGEDTDAEYRAKERLLIECVPETAEGVVVEVADAGGTVESVHFHLHEDIRRQLQDEALAAAMQRAREKAERIAAVEGAVVAEVQSVTTREVSTGMNSIVDEALSRPPDTDVAPEPVGVTEAVEAVFELTAE